MSPQKQGQTPASCITDMVMQGLGFPAANTQHTIWKNHYYVLFYTGLVKWCRLVLNS